MSIFMAVLQGLDYYSFVVSFEIRNCESSDFVLLFQDCFDYLRFIAFPFEFKMSFFISAKNTIGILIGTALNLFLETLSS